jgi:hypothetical protein
MIPQRGASREDMRKNLRTLVFEHRKTIAYRIIDTSVVFLGAFGAGQGVTTELANPELERQCPSPPTSKPPLSP